MGAPPYDVVVVLGTRVRPDGSASAALGRRVARGVELFKAGQGGAMLLCGGVGRHSPSAASEASVMRDIALAAGLDDGQLTLEDQSRTTLENALNARAIMAERGWETALVVTDRLHLPRALLAFRGVGIRASGQAVIGAGQGPFRRPWQFLAYEACAFPWYLTRIVFGRRRLRAAAHSEKTAGTRPDPLVR